MEPFMKPAHLARLFTLLLLASLSLPAMATERIWPGSAPCNGTLQACINAVAGGDTVLIAINTPINENLTINKSLVLKAQSGFRPIFASGSTIVGDSAVSGWNVEIAALNMPDGHINLNRTSSATDAASFKIHDMRMISATTISDVISLSGKPFNFSVTNNWVAGIPNGGMTVGLIRVSTKGASQGTLAFNRVDTPALGQGAGILLDAFNGSEVTANIYGNVLHGIFGDTLHGNYSSGALVVQEGVLSSAPSTVTAHLFSNVVAGGNGQGVGILTQWDAGTMNIATINNSVVGMSRGVQYWPLNGYDSLGTLSSVFANNLLAWNSGFGLLVHVGHIGDLSSFKNNLFWNDGNEQPLPGSGTANVTSNPRLWSLDQPRITPGSYALEAGDTTTLALGSLLYGIPLIDADGLRRIKQTEVDIGAYEFGDFNWLASKATPGSHTFPIIDPRTDLNPDAKLFIAQNWNPDGFGGTYNNHAEGLWYDALSWHWNIFNEDTNAIPQGAAFNVFMPAGPDVFVHQATIANTTGNRTKMDNSAVNNQPNDILLVSQNWNPPSMGGVYNPSPVAAGYLAGADNHWYAVNLNGSAVPTSANFNVYSQSPSPNAFVHVSSAANIISNWTVIDHPLLNGTPCAQVMFSQRLVPGSTVNPHGTGIYYDGTHWAIFNEDLAAMPQNVQFSVLVNPAQIAECSDVIFADGFD